MMCLPRTACRLAVRGVRRGLFTPVVHTVYMTLPSGNHTVRLVSPDTGLSAEGTFDMPAVGKRFCLVVYTVDDTGKPGLSREDILSVTELKLNGLEPSDVSDLAQFANLQKLEVCDNLRMELARGGVIGVALMS